ncbi:BMP family ABC transporter substrate-binding protein [Clostridium sp. DSM 100503]|uniref:BMP family lipoprotein n=1 Tax=Clostridium sp. DSM 100503 TaxID=2963282 RepID=UPI00214A6AA8|nr:BMP family ABC transporter substrate-binding protein [Clostridium sp. DSM 100503]MCR1952387.1 BMP family ABC transporter substrate-binding protein [Clostridium sp. DSM 100503]
MNKQRLFLLTLSICLISMLVSCGVLNSHVIDLDRLKVAYVINKGCLEDKGLNQLGLEGINKSIIEDSIKLTIIEIDRDDEDSFQKQFIKAVKSNDLIIVVGEEFKNVVNEAATNYRNKRFIVTTNKIRESNVQNVDFKYEEGGFLVGAIAGKRSSNKDVGYIAIKDNEPNKLLLSGYMAGIKVTNPKALSKLLSEENVKYVEDCANVDLAYEQAIELYDKGCEVILTAAGRASEGVFKAAKEKGKYVINSGMNAQEVYSDYKDNVLASLVIRFDDILYKSISEANDGMFKSGEINKINEGLKENTIEIIMNESILDKETINLVNNYKSEVIKEKIEIPKIKEEVLEFRVQ